MNLPLRSLADQVAAALRGEIRQQRWREVLPPERTLAERLRVSRKTLRKALAQLRRDGLVRADGRRACRIVPRHPRERAAPQRVALLLPHPPENARQFTLLWINRVMALLQEAGLKLEIEHGTRYYAANPARALARLTSGQPATCWLLARSTIEMQQWFAGAGLPALVCGSTYEGIRLPQVDVDHRALCRHAASTLLRAGHQQLAMFLDLGHKAGDKQSEEGFHEGLRAARRPMPAPIISRMERRPAAIGRELRRVMSLPRPPTAILLFHSDTYLTVATYLGDLGLRVPQDVSLVCRDEEPFLDFVHPTPARYHVEPAKFAAKVAQALHRVQQGDRTPFAISIMPRFARNDSLLEQRGG